MLHELQGSFPTNSIGKHWLGEDTLRLILFHSLDCTGNSLHANVVDIWRHSIQKGELLFACQDQFTKLGREATPQIADDVIVTRFGLS